MTHRGDILVIEEDAALGDFILDALSDEGYTARVITDAADVDTAIIAGMPDLVLCELRLPFLSDRDLILQLRHALPADVSIVVMSTDTQAVHQLDDLNIAFCLMKPFELIALFACVAAYIRVPR
jgi:DNA-binding response OmpR family regulator